MIQRKKIIYYIIISNNTNVGLKNSLNDDRTNQKSDNSVLTYKISN